MKTQIIRVLAACFIITSSAVVTLMAFPPAVLAMPVLVGVGGFISQRWWRWGMTFAVSVSVGLLPCGIFGTAWFCKIEPGQLWYVFATPYAYQVAVILGVPWLFGSLIGNAMIREGGKADE